MKRILIFVMIVVIIVTIKFYIDNRETTNVDIIDGGTVNNSFDAPKIIQSRDLASINAEFFYTENFGAHDYAFMSIKLERNNNEELVLSEENRFNISVKVGEEVLKGVQELIDRFKLSELNGTDKYTSGLPVPFSPIYFNASYDSGESIVFGVDGDPDEPWCNEFAQYFIDVFEKYGETSILSQSANVEIVKFDVEYNDGETVHSYTCETIENMAKIFKYEYNCATNEVLHEEYIDIPESYYDELEILLKGLKYYTFINNIDGFFEANKNGAEKFSISIVYADNSCEYGSFEGEEVTSEMTDKIEKILSFVDQYFE